MKVKHKEVNAFEKKPNNIKDLACTNKYATYFCCC